MVNHNQAGDSWGHNSVELHDWTGGDSSLLLRAWDSAYRPLRYKMWNNIAFSVDYDMSSHLETITMYGYDDGEFYMRA